MKTETLQDLYLKELRDLYGSEQQLVNALPKFLANAEIPELRQVLAHLLEEAKDQSKRLEKVFESHGEKPQAKQGKVLDGILKEAMADMADVHDGALRDAAIVAAVQQIKAFEVAAYGTLQSYAIHLGYTEASHILQSILNEERRADQKLTDLALNHLQLAGMRQS